MSVSQWTHLGDLEDLSEHGREVVKLGRRQIAIFETEEGLFACNNRCPHEGYPLVEGTFPKPCLLVCNWHGWSFDLKSGKTLSGADLLRLYPIERRDDGIWIDIKDPPKAQQIERALETIAQAAQHLDYDHIARGLARLVKAGGSLEDAISRTINWASGYFDYGAGHGLAATADWMSLTDELRAGEIAGEMAEESGLIIPTLESIFHLAWDARMGKDIPYATKSAPWNEGEFLNAVDLMDEPKAVELLNGALKNGIGWPGLLPVLSKAALAHYAGFGHVLIYLNKCNELYLRLGKPVLSALALSLTRYMINARRDDLIPEFRSYAPALAAFGDKNGGGVAKPDEFVGLSVDKSLALAVASAGDNQQLYNSLLKAAALMMLHFDEALVGVVDQPVSKNISWLDFTHAITFANAVRVTAERMPELWPAGLLQMAAFIGRNARGVKNKLDFDQWRVSNKKAFRQEVHAHLFDHGEVDPIYSCHMLKLFVACEREAEASDDDELGDLLFAAYNRFRHGTLKRRHVRRSANQAMDLVGRED